MGANGATFYLSAGQPIRTKDKNNESNANKSKRKQYRMEMDGCLRTTFKRGHFQQKKQIG
jgi:hypothetical protein